MLAILGLAAFMSLPVNYPEVSLLGKQGDTRPVSILAKVDQALLITSISASAVASSMTLACKEREVLVGDCREVNPIMDNLLNSSQSTAAIVKAAIQGVAHWLIWRFVPEGKWRTLSLGLFAGLNIADAWHDVVVMRRLERNR